MDWAFRSRKTHRASGFPKVLLLAKEGCPQAGAQKAPLLAKEGCPQDGAQKAPLLAKGGCPQDGVGYLNSFALACLDCPSITARVRGFLKFDRFRINDIFYFRKIKPYFTKYLVMPKISSQEFG